MVFLSSSGGTDAARIESVFKRLKDFRELCLLALYKELSLVSPPQVNYDINAIDRLQVHYTPSVKSQIEWNRRSVSYFFQFS